MPRRASVWKSWWPGWMKCHGTIVPVERIIRPSGGITKWKKLMFQTSKSRSFDLERHRWYAKFEARFGEIYVLHAAGHWSFGSVGLADVHAKSTWGMCAAFLLVYASILWVRRISITITDKRAIVQYLTYGERLRLKQHQARCAYHEFLDSKLYRIVINKDYPVAFRQRMEKIVENDEKMSKGGNENAILDSIGYPRPMREE